jgi:hypothetical protein
MRPEGRRGGGLQCGCRWRRPRELLSEVLNCPSRLGKAINSFNSFDDRIYRAKHLSCTDQVNVDEGDIRRPGTKIYMKVN